ncbi:MAG: 4Fe-4S ferredoxin [Ignavibacteria bacterium CG2_30_36_16]|nr:NAD(P)-binding domain-containing protein [Ignavibacteria bacterium]OIP63065.1 MAG: 4Fe-4S ferredoxin [Ignavibacteria bacterium CG2_30_36_16]
MISGGIFFYYLRKKKKASKVTSRKIAKAKEMGFHEPVSLHPVVNLDICLGSGACIKACPEKDILGIVSGQAHTINASRCVGHGACFHACPVQAISLCIGTEKRGVELPHVSQEFETNIKGLYIAGELGGMGLIKNAVEQGKQALQNITKNLNKNAQAEYDVVIVGAGPAGISATLEASKQNLKSVTLEQDSLGGTVYSFPRAKVVMTSPMDLPLHGKIKLGETSKSELLGLWMEILGKYNISINEQEKVESIEKQDDTFIVMTNKGHYTTRAILLSIGRRGTPRKLGVPGEENEKVYYRLLEPELIHEQNILVVGGGDSAIESALLLVEENNKVTLSYRSNSFSRIKPRNLEKINQAANSGEINVIFNSTVVEIKDDEVLLSIENSEEITIPNDLVYVFAGGELPTKFLEKIGITITKKFGDAVLKGR